MLQHPSARALVGMDNAQSPAENVVMIQGGTTEGCFFIDSRQDANTAPLYDTCPLVCALVGMNNLVCRNVRLFGWPMCACRRISFLLLDV